jgi:tetratricopeptide (TPR) repeat protein
MVAVSGGGWLWLRWQAQTRRAEADRGAALALAKADQWAERALETDRGTVPGAETAVGLWQQALAAGEQAKGVAASAGDLDLWPGVARRAEALREGLARAEADLMLARRDAALRADLDRARSRLAGTAGGEVDWAGASRAYQEALQTAGLPARAEPEVLGAAIQGERPGVREALVEALDQWADCLKRGPEQERLRTAANRADGDPLRCQIRAALSSRDRGELMRLADASTSADLPAVTAVLLSNALRSQRQLPKAERLLRTARERDPGDFEVLNALGSLLVDMGRDNPVKVEEAVGCMRAALALRPDSPRALLNLGFALSNKNDWPGAEACFRKTLRLDPRSAMAHNNLGNARFNQNDYEGAIACCRQAIQLDPQLALAHGTLGLALQAKKDLKDYNTNRSLG